MLKQDFYQHLLAQRIFLTIIILKRLEELFTQANDNAIYRLMQSLPTKLNGKDKEQENKAENFSYDAVGNRQTGPETKDIYSYNNGNQLTNDRKHQYEYDKNGNLIKKIERDDDGETETTTYSY